jgi:hypothetical protein
VIALEIHGDLHRSEVVVLPQMNDLADDFRMGHGRAVQRRARAVLQTLEAFVLVAPLPAVEDVATDAVVAAGRGDIAADLRGMPQHSQTPIGAANKVLLAPHSLGHGSPSSQETQTVNDVCQF